MKTYCVGAPNTAPGVGKPHSPLSPILPPAYEEPAPGGGETEGRGVSHAFLSRGFSGHKGPADCLLIKGNGGVRKLEVSPVWRSLGRAAYVSLCAPLPPIASHLPPSRRQGPQLLAQPGRAAAALISHRATFLGRRNCRWQLVISQASPFH